MKVVKSSIRDQVYEEIKRRILMRKYPPGYVLNIVHLSQELGVSNSPIREALSMLVNEKLVTVTANTKFRVIKLDEELLQQLNSSIVSLLIGAARLCYKEHRLDQLEESMEKAFLKQCSADKTVDQKDRYWLAVEFDRSIITATGNTMLEHIFENWSNLLYLSTSLVSEAYNNSIAEHAQILKAVKSGDFLKIVEKLEIHYDKHFLPTNME
ncbi:MAG: GntR family transcriptional regulator [Clostridiales bacterium]|nr:GntR family transcriptional regulator [Clostridiales bacterium]